MEIPVQISQKRDETTFCTPELLKHHRHQSRSTLVQPNLPPRDAFIRNFYSGFYLHRSTPTFQQVYAILRKCTLLTV